MLGVRSGQVSELTDPSIIALANACKSLVTLDLQCCYQLTDPSILAIAENCKSLEKLDVGACSKLTDPSIIAIADNCKSLEKLIVAGCTQVTLPEHVGRRGLADILRWYDGKGMFTEEQLRACVLDG